MGQLQLGGGTRHPHSRHGDTLPTLSLPPHPWKGKAAAWGLRQHLPPPHRTVHVVSSSAWPLPGHLPSDSDSLFQPVPA